MIIKCLLLLVINDLEKVEQKKEGEQDKNDVHLSDINSEYKLLENFQYNHHLLTDLYQGLFYLLLLHQE